MATLGTKYEKGDKQGMTAAKAFSAPPQNIKIVVGHNYRKVDPERVEMFRQMYLAGKDVPPILVALGEDNELELVDGEHRVRAAILAEVKKVPMVEFSGTKAERLFAAWRYNQGSKGTAVETARAFLRMREGGYSNAEIARETGASEGTVANHLLLAMSGEGVLAMVEAGDVAATPVINMARSIGPDKVLAALKDAKAAQPAPKTTSKNTPEPGKFKTRKERVTEKRLKRVQAEVQDEAEERRARVYLKTLMAHLPNVELVNQGSNADVELAPADQSLTLRCPAGSWRELRGMVSLITEFLATQEAKKNA